VSEAELIAQLAERLDHLESAASIRALMADYMRLCDHLDATTPMDELGLLFTVDAVWTGRGARYAAAFGGHRGRAAILAMFESYRSPPHFSFNAHFLTSEKITVTGDSARGEWMMLQTATYPGGKSDLRSARLTVDFTRSAARWQICRFETENLFSRPVGRWDDPAPIPVPQAKHSEAS
jgi:ketosteroid isomerase-like protein